MSKKNGNWKSRGDWGSSSGRAPKPRSEKGCAVLAIGMLGGALAAAYAAVEGIRAAIS